MPALKKVEVTAAAIGDLDRLDAFLRPKNPRAADRLGEALLNAFARIEGSPDAGRSSHRPGSEHFRERLVRLGRSTYVILYSTEPERILIVRISHAREKR